MRTSVESVDVYLGFYVSNALIPTTLMGRNDFPMLNPPLPRALEVGDNMKWLTVLSTVGMMTAMVRGINPTLMAAEVWTMARLGSGEQIASERHAFDELPLPSAE